MFDLNLDYNYNYNFDYNFECWLLASESDCSLVTVQNLARSNLQIILIQNPIVYNFLLDNTKTLVFNTLY